MADYTDKNREVINGWCRDGWEWGRPISHEVFVRAKKGDYALCITAAKPVPKAWIEPAAGKKVLALAGGGGQQGPILTALGADVTVLDYSDVQLETERMVAAREGYDITVVQADMTKRLPFEDESFDMIIHPVSNCYIQDVYHVWLECFRILKSGGRLIAGLDNGMNFIVDDAQERIVYELPFDPLKNKAHLKKSMACNEGFQFSHGVEEQIGGQLRAGFILKDIYEDTNGSGRLHEMNIPSFWASLAVKP